MTNTPDTLLPIPSDQYTERFILGSVLLDSEFMNSLRGVLDADDFYAPRHRHIWGACCAAFDAGSEANTATVYMRLREIGKQEAAGGLSYLADVTEGVPVLLSLDAEVQKLKGFTLKRRMVALAHNVMLRCASSESAWDIHEALLSGAQGLSMKESDRSAVSTRDIVDRIGVQELLMPSRNKSGLRVPWERLQSAIGGMRGGQILIVAAYTSRGKSSLACQIATHCTRQATGVFYWTTEMTPESLFRRMVDQMSGVDGLRHREACLSHDELTRARDAVGWLYDHPVWFDRTSHTVPAMLASLRQVQQKHEIGLVVVDHLQHVKSSGRQFSRAQEVSEISRALKMAALDLDLPFLVVSQVSRPKEDDAPLTIHMLKESGDCENDADVVMLLNSPKPAGLSPVTVSLNVAKQREGPAGFDIPLTFRPSTQSFESLEE